MLSNIQQYVEFSMKGEKTYQNSSHYQKPRFSLSFPYLCILTFITFQRKGY